MKTFATVRTYKVDFKLQFAKNESNNNFFASRVVFVKNEACFELLITCHLLHSKHLKIKQDPNSF